jgi:2'-5' RNA ligase
VETAVVIAFLELCPVVDEWRERTCADRTSLGIPPHVTLLHPFVPTDAVEGTVDDLRTVFAATRTFEVSFRELRRWPGMAYLAPEPPEPFARLTEEIVNRWPDYPPYEGIHETVIPHLTVAYGDDALLAETEADVAPKLPVQAVVTGALLLEEIDPDSGRWETRARFQLGVRDDR